MRLILFMAAMLAAEAGATVPTDESLAPTRVDMLQVKIGNNELLQPADVAGLECAEAWILSNSVLARHGFMFVDDRALEQFDWDPMYQPNPEVTYFTYHEYLTDSDIWNLELLMAIEARECNGTRTLTIEPSMSPVVPDEPIVIGALADVQPEMSLASLQEDDDLHWLDDDEEAFEFDEPVVIEEPPALEVENRGVVEPGEGLELKSPEMVVVITDEGRVEQPLEQLAPSNWDEIEELELEDAVVQADPGLDSDSDEELAIIDTGESRDDGEEKTEVALEPPVPSEPAVQLEVVDVEMEADSAPVCEDHESQIAELTAERDKLAGDIAIMEERNENLIDSNTALALEAEEANARLGEAALAAEEPKEAPAAPVLVHSADESPQCVEAMNSLYYAELMSDTCLVSLGELTMEYEEVVPQIEALEAQIVTLRGEIEVYEAHLAEGDEQAQAKIAELTRERDELLVMQASLEAQNREVMDANVMLTTRMSLMEEQAGEVVATVPALAANPPVIIEEDLLEVPAVVSADVTKPVFDPFDELQGPIAVGKVAPKELFGEMDCDQTKQLYWMIPARHGVGSPTPELYNSADQLNELRLERQAREQGCELAPASS